MKISIFKNDKYIIGKNVYHVKSKNKNKNLWYLF